MKTYNILKMSNDRAWSDIPRIDIDIPYLDSPEDIRAYAQIAYNDEAILVHLWTKESETRAVETGETGVPCEDSCLEFFFCPMENDDRYFNIEFNANGCMYLGFASDISNLIRLLPDEIGAGIFEPKIVKKEDGWEIFYSVPYSFIRRFFKDFEVHSGKTMAANCYKCSDLTVPAHYFSWSKVEGDTFTFHRPNCFGKMTFVD